MSIVPWEDVFALRDKTPRPQQRETLDAITSAILEGKKTFVCELGTGCGKSAVGVTLENWLAVNNTEFMCSGLLSVDVPRSKAYVLTTQKILQDQYVREFGEYGLFDVRSSDNYMCNWAQSSNCGEIMRLNRAVPGVTGCAGCPCPYAIQKASFKEANIGVTNYSYMLSENLYAGGLDRRRLLVMDECHTLENNLRSWAATQITRAGARSIGVQEWPKQTDKAIDEWLQVTYAPACSRKKQQLLTRLRKSPNGSSAPSLLKSYDFYDKHLCSLNRFLECQFGTEAVRTEYLRIHNGDVIELKPVDVSGFANDLYKQGEIKLFMSATVLDVVTFAKTVGFDANDAVVIRKPSPFPTQHRPFIVASVAKMSKSHIDESLPKMAQAIDEVLKQHHNQKGIIHTNSYKVAQYIVNALRNDRLLLPEAGTRDTVLRHHTRTDKPTVLVSPSMTEGIDLCDDLSRFQIIAKMPFPYLGDPVVRRLMHENRKWYDWTTARTILQAVGRSVRHEKDEAVTYMLDSDWVEFYRRNVSMFPEDFQLTVTKV